MLTECSARVRRHQRSASPPCSRRSSTPASTPQPTRRRRQREEHAGENISVFAANLVARSPKTLGRNIVKMRAAIRRSRRLRSSRESPATPPGSRPVPPGWRHGSWMSSSWSASPRGCTEPGTRPHRRTRRAQDRCTDVTAEAPLIMRHMATPVLAVPLASQTH